MISEETETIDVYDSALTLDGLRIIYEKNADLMAHIGKKKEK